MRVGFFCLSVAMLSGSASADALLSIAASAGTQSCSQTGTASASCSVNSTVSVAGGQFNSPVYAGGAISYGATNLGAGSPGPPSVGPLDYSLEGNWAMGQGIGLSGQAAVTLSASIDLPSGSGNWTFYGTGYDATDDQGGAVGPIEIVTSDGSGWISGAASSFTIAHTPGTPFSVWLNASDLVEEADSSNQFNFEVRMVDPVATPEPGTWLMVLGSVPGLLLLRKLRIIG
jgi:hypothetical protein